MYVCSWVQSLTKKDNAEVSHFTFSREAILRATYINANDHTVPASVTASVTAIVTVPASVTDTAAVIATATVAANDLLLLLLLMLLLLLLLLLLPLLLLLLLIQLLLLLMLSIPFLHIISVPCPFRTARASSTLPVSDSTFAHCDRAPSGVAHPQAPYTLQLSLCPSLVT